MTPFHVIIYDFNKKDFEPYDIMPYFINEYNDKKDKPKSFDEFKKFVKDKSLYEFWARCQYEIILSDWPPSGKVAKKWDIHKQILMNIDLITELLIKNISNEQ